MTQLASFFRDYGGDILVHTYEHIYLTFLAMAIAIVIAVPLGICLSRNRWPRLVSVIMSTASTVQTVPTLALIAFIVVIFVYVSLPTVGVFPGMVALVLYALFPILCNTHTGIRQVDPYVIEVATGMGMKPHQILFAVELPLSLPIIMAGVRISTVWTIGIATLCGLIGAGGLGDLIIRGLQMTDAPLILAGTIPAAALALIFNWILGGLEKWLTPEGMRSASRGE